MSFIEIKNLTKVLDGKTILNNVSLSINEGEFFTLLGFSGCGKTTTLKSISGIYSIDNGDILVNGNSVINTPMEKRNMPFVFQEPYLFPHMKVYDNIAFALKVKNTPKDEIDTKVYNIIKSLELDGLEKMYPNKLSGGQKQRVALGRALITSPKILLLDEPFSSLDITLRSSMRALIKRLHKDLNLTIIFVTHDKEEALTLSDKIALMENGTILQIGSPEEIYEKPKNAKVANFFGNCNLIKGSITNGIFESNLGISTNQIENPKENYLDSCKLVVRSEDLLLSPSENSNLIIKDKLYVGDKFIYEIQILNNPSLSLKSRANKNLNLNIGSTVSISLNTDSLYSIL